MTATTTKARGLGIMPGLSLPTSFKPVDRTAWNEAFATMDAARQAASVADARHDDAFAEYERIKPSDDMVDWKEFPFLARHHVLAVLDVEQHWRDFLAGQGMTWFAPDPEARKRHVRATLDALLEYRRLDREAMERSGLDEAGQVCDDLGGIRCDTASALILVPAPDGPALLWKMEHLFGECVYTPDLSEEDGHRNYCDPWRNDLVEAVMSDARRLLSIGRA